MNRALAIEVNNAPTKRFRDRGNSITDVEFREDVLCVSMHGLIAYRQCKPDLAIGQALRHQFEHLDLPNRERRSARAVRETRSDFGGERTFASVHLPNDSNQVL